MKSYNEYMNNIVVSNTLHRKFLAVASGTKHARRPAMIKRYAVLFTYLAALLLSISVIPKLLNSLIPAPTGNLVFNKAASHIESYIHIPGHFWQELTSSECQAVFPGLTQQFDITATANFQSHGESATLFNIEAHGQSPSGLKTYIQVSPGNIKLDYKFESDVTTSDVLGTPVMAGYFETKQDSKGLGKIIYFAYFDLSDAAYYVELSGEKLDNEYLKNDISQLIGLLVKGRAANFDILDPVIPELREDHLNLEEARLDADFGSYVPVSLPQAFVFEDALRFVNQEQDSLSVNWTKGMSHIQWRISKLDDQDATRITSIADKENYDLSLYPVPFAHSIPDNLREIVSNPIFRKDELTLETVYARTYKVSDTGDEPGYRMSFGVLCGNVLVEISVKDVSPEEIFAMLQQIGN